MSKKVVEKNLAHSHVVFLDKRGQRASESVCHDKGKAEKVSEKICKGNVGQLNSQQFNCVVFVQTGLLWEVVCCV